MNLAISVASIWQISVLYGLSKSDASHQLKLIMLADTVQLLARGSRSVIMYFQEIATLPSLFQEEILGFGLRVIAGPSTMMVCILIANYYLEKLMQEHKKVPTPLRTAC